MKSLNGVFGLLMLGSICLVFVSEEVSRAQNGRPAVAAAVRPPFHKGGRFVLHGCHGLRARKNPGVGDASALYHREILR